MGHHVISDVVRAECMQMWAAGNTLRDVSKQQGISVNTLLNWKRANNPESWEGYRQKLVKESLAATLQEIRVKAAQEVNEHWKDLGRTRGIMRIQITKLENDLNRGDLTAAAFDRTVDQIRKIISGLKSLQEQQFLISNLGWIKTDIPELPQSGGGYSDEELNRLKDDPTKLLEIATAAAKGNDRIIDVSAPMSTDDDLDD